MPSKQKNNLEKLIILLRRYFNQQIKLYYQKKRKTEPNTSTRTSTQVFLEKIVSIEKDDSVPVITLKLIIFFFVIQKLGRDAIALIPENWATKAIVDRPQLKIIYRVDGKTASGNYDLTIPHYNGNPKPKFPAYRKGRFWARLTLKDNSKIVIYARDQKEALRVLKVLKQYVSTKYLTDNIVTGEINHKTTTRFKELRVTPYRADYFKTGQQNSVPDKRYYFQNF
jgi:hypothetical protein